MSHSSSNNCLPLPSVIKTSPRPVFEPIIGSFLAPMLGLVPLLGLALSLTTTNLNAQVPEPISRALLNFGDLNSYQISPDGKRMVFVADKDFDNIMELYTVPLAGGKPVRLNGALTEGGNVSYNFQVNFLVTPDSSRVVYRADEKVDDQYELFSVPIAGGAPTRINGDLVEDGDVLFGFTLSADGKTIVYRADQDDNNVYELYSAPVAGGKSIKLSAPMAASGFVQNGYTISPDNQMVVYRADQEKNNVFELYSTSIKGGKVTKLNSKLATNGDVLSDFQISEDSQRVLYRSDQDRDQVTELYSVPLKGGNVAKLNSEMPGTGAEGGDVSFDFSLSPNSQRVVYRADQEKDGVFELFSVPIAGGKPIKLNAKLLKDGKVYVGAQVSNDGKWVVYRAELDHLGVREIYSVPITGGNSKRLNADLIDGSQASPNFEISSSSEQVIYEVLHNDEAHSTELFSVEIGGGVAVKLDISQ